MKNYSKIGQVKMTQPLYRLKKHIVIFCSSILLSLTSVAQVDTLSNSELISYFQNKKTTTVYLSKKAVQNNNDILYGLAKLDKKQRGVPLQIEDRTRLNSLLKKVINLNETESDNYSDSLSLHISRMNGITDRNPSFREGDSIKLPTIAKAIKELNTTKHNKFAVHYDFENDTLFMYKIINSIKEGERVMIDATIDSASLISLDVQNENVNEFLNRYCISEINSGTIYIETGIEICPIEFPGSSFVVNHSNNLELLQPDLISEIVKIDPTKVNEYYFFDTFISSNNGCSHGESVNSIITHILDHYDISVLKPKVKAISLDFFENRDKALEIISDYISLKYNQNGIDERLKAKLRYYRNISSTGCTGLCMPSDYLNILLDYYLMKKPEVISMSFYMKTPYPAVSFSINPEMTTNLLGAVMNFTGAIEDLDTDLAGCMNEPLYTLKSNILETGSMLIGAESTPGNYSCLHSKDGLYVSTVGRGYWDDSFACAPQVYGTSWATPEIATKLFIAKAYWASVGLNINAFEAKKRLLLACDLDKNLVNKFASPGIPNINKLIRKDEDGFIEIISESTGSEIHAIEILKNKPKMIVNVEDGKIPWRLEKSDSFFSFSGLYYKDGDIFLFSESKMKWVPLEDFIELDSSTNIQFKNFKILLIDSNLTIDIKSLTDLENYNINQIAVL